MKILHVLLSTLVLFFIGNTILQAQGLEVTQGTENSSTSLAGSHAGGYSWIGLAPGQHISLDADEVQSRLNHGPSTLRLNPHGGDVLLTPPFIGVAGYDGNVGVGVVSPTARLHVISNDTNTIRLESTGLYGSGAKINFGDANYVFLDEFEDDKLMIFADDGVFIRGHNDYMVGPSEMVPYTRPVDFQASPLGAYGYGNFVPEFNSLNAPVHLPSGVQVEYIVLYFDDTHAGVNLNCSLVRRAPLGSPEVMASISSSGNGGMSSDITLNILHSIIDNDQFQYYVRVTTNNNSTWGSAISFKGLKITYF
jgi:hypothetical protein